MNTLSLRIIRYSWVVLFLWFGFQQVTEPGSWVGFLPAWIGYIPMPGEMIVQLNGWFEIVSALFLLTGTWIRIVSALLAVHLMGIAVSAGGAIGMRDAILSMMGVALAVAEPDSWTVDYKSKKIVQ